MDYGTIMEVITSAIFLLTCIIIAIMLPSYVQGTFSNFNIYSVPLTAVTLEYEESMIGYMNSTILIYYGPNNLSNFRIITEGFGSGNNNYQVEYGMIILQNFENAFLTDLLYAVIMSLPAVGIEASSVLSGSEKAVEDAAAENAAQGIKQGAQSAAGAASYGSFLSLMTQYLKFSLKSIVKLYSTLYAANFGLQLAETLLESGYAGNPIAATNAVMSELSNTNFYLQTAVYTAEGVALGIAQEVVTNIITTALDISGFATLGIGFLISFVFNFVFLALQTLCEIVSLNSHPYFYGYLYNAIQQGDTVIFQPSVVAPFSNNNNIYVYAEYLPNGQFNYQNYNTTGLLLLEGAFGPNSAYSIIMQCAYLDEEYNETLSQALQQCSEFVPATVTETLGYTSVEGNIYYVTGYVQDGNIIYYGNRLIIEKENGSIYLYTLANNITLNSLI